MSNSNVEAVDRTGERYLTNDGSWLTIVGWRGCMDCDVQFDETIFIIKNRTYNNVKKGYIKNMMRLSVHGVGYLGYGRHKAHRGSKMYDVWKSIMQRSYSYNYHKIRPTYTSCSVDPHWHCFQNFGDWFEENWKSYMGNNWHLDKDILKKGDKVYSLDTCCFVPQEINALFIKRKHREDNLPTGVYKKCNGYAASLSKQRNSPYLGTFDSIEEAFECYRFHKELWIKEIADTWRDMITEECYIAMYNRKIKITD